jgi:hypothetical protein
LVADVVVVVGVVGEFDIGGPDSLGFGAADASAVAPMMTMPARQLVAKTLRIMIHTLFSARTLGAPTPWVRMASATGFNCPPSPDDNNGATPPASGASPRDDFVWTGRQPATPRGVHHGAVRRVLDAADAHRQHHLLAVV